MIEINKYLISHNIGGVYVFGFKKDALDHIEYCVKNGISFTFTKGTEKISDEISKFMLYEKA